MFAIVDHVGELTDPIAEDDDARLLGELLVDLDMAMAVDEVVHVGVILDVLLGIENQVLLVVAHIVRWVSPHTMLQA